ncbi:hypothetical protein RFI_28222, partial [Reticulomyxa filosa]
MTSEECVSPLSTATPALANIKQKSSNSSRSSFAYLHTAPNTTKTVVTVSTATPAVTTATTTTTTSNKSNRMHPSPDTDTTRHARSRMPSLSTIAVAWNNHAAIRSEKTVLEEVWECIRCVELIDPCFDKDSQLLRSYRTRLYPHLATSKPPTTTHANDDKRDQSKQEQDQHQQEQHGDQDEQDREEEKEKNIDDEVEQLCTVADWKYYMRMQIASETIDRLGGICLFVLLFHRLVGLVHLGVDDSIAHCSLDKLRQIFYSCISRRLHAQLVQNLEKETSVLSRKVKQKDRTIDKLTAAMAKYQAALRQTPSSQRYLSSSQLTTPESQQRPKIDILEDHGHEH